MLLLVALLAPSARAGGAVGVDWIPYSRADLIWVSEDQSSGTLVGEFDGLVRPAMTAYGGLMGDRNAWLFAFGVARTSSVDWDGEGYRRVSASAYRPSADWQWYLRDRAVGAAVPWVGLGLHVTIPQAKDTADIYTTQEQSDADEGARALKGRIGGVGSRAGFGGDYRVNQGLSVGLRYYVTAYRGQVSSGDSLSVSWLTWGETALRLQLEL